MREKIIFIRDTEDFIDESLPNCLKSVGAEIKLFVYGLIIPELDHSNHGTKELLVIIIVCTAELRIEGSQKHILVECNVRLLR